MEQDGVLKAMDGLTDVGEIFRIAGHNMLSGSHNFHIPPSWVGDSAVTIPPGQIYKQLRSVLRVQKGDAVRFFDGLGNVAECSLAHISQEGIIATINNCSAQVRPTAAALAIAILKNDRMRFVLEKATELGVSAIIPMTTERVIKRPDATPPRWELIIKEAAEQSGRAWLPMLEPVHSFKEVIEKHPNPLVCHLGSFEPIERVKMSRPATILIGPEGGFTEDEVAFAEHKKIPIVSLGDFALRADTAAIVALTIGKFNIIQKVSIVPKPLYPVI